MENSTEFNDIPVMENPLNTDAHYTQGEQVEQGPRIVELSMTRIAALTAIGKSNQQIADIYGVKSTDIAKAKVSFGMYKTRKSKDGNPKVPPYITTLAFDMEM